MRSAGATAALLCGLAFGLSAVVFSMAAGSEPLVRGTLYGRSTLVSGFALGTINPVVAVTLPPGDGWSGPFAANLADGRVLVTGTGYATCGGRGVDDVFVYAACTTEIRSLSLSVDGVEVFRAARLRSTVRVESDGGIPAVDTSGSISEGVCVMDADATCQPVAIGPNGAASFQTALASGLLTVGLVSASNPLFVRGDGAQVVGLSLTLATPAFNHLALNFAVAEAFIGDAVLCDAPPLGTATPTWTPDREAQTPIPTPTPSCTPRPQGTPTTPPASATTVPPLAYRVPVLGLAADESP